MKEMKPEQEKNRDVLEEMQRLESEQSNFWTESTEGESADETEEAAFYEKRRKERHERALKRRRKRKLGRILMLVAAAVIVIGCGGYFYGDKIGLKQGAETLMAKAKSLLAPEEREEKQITGGDDETEKELQVTEVPKEEPKVTEIPDEEAEAEAQAAAAAVDQAEAEREKEVLSQAHLYAVQYDYDSAISLLKSDEAFADSTQMQQAADGYQETKDSCVSWSPQQVTHVFYHSLIVDPSKAFDGDYKADGYNQMMTTMKEFNQITQTMYDRGYVMVSIYDLAQMDENGVMTAKEILLPEGKTPFVLSQDDLCYYHCQDGDGFASKLVLDEEGKVRCEYVQDDGSVTVGDYDVVPLIDRFVEANPGFSYHGAKGIIALTGYNGILGYRTDISYQTRPDDLYEDKIAWLDAHPDFNLETERAGAKAVADAMKAEGWLFASHTWGHKNMSDVSMERLITDTQKFKENVDPLIGGTDIIIFAFGADINKGEDYTGEEKFDYLKSQGYNYYCNVDSSQYFVQIRDTYFRMGRRNLDGYRMYYNPDLLADLFDAKEVFDPARPTPVPPMNGG